MNHNGGTLGAAGPSAGGFSSGGFGGGGFGGDGSFEASSCGRFGGGGDGGAFGMENPNAKAAKKSSKPRTDYKTLLSKVEQQLKTTHRDLNRWRRRAVRSEMRHDAIRAQQIHLLMTQVAGDDFGAATVAWLVQLLNGHGQKFQECIGAHVSSHSTQVKSLGEIEGQVHVADTSASTKETLQSHVDVAYKAQNKVLQEAWYNDLRPVLKSFDDADKLLDEQQLLLCSWQTDIAVAQQLLPLITKPEEQKTLVALIHMCEKPIIILQAEISFLEQQH